MKILFVDDKETWHKLFDIILSLRGTEVIHARTVEEALNAVSRESPDIAIVDTTISMSSGYDLIPELVKLRIPVIFIGYEKEGFDVDKALSLGALKALKKPFTVKELLSVLKEVKDKEKAVSVEPDIVIPSASESEESFEVTDISAEEPGIPVVPVNETSGGEELFKTEIREKGEEVVKLPLEEKIPVVEVQEEPEGDKSEERINEIACKELKGKIKEENLFLPEEKIEEIVREIAWEVIPEVAEKVIREEVEKLIKSRLA